MRYQYLLILFFFLPAKMFAQSGETDITGLWKGTLYNDSTNQFYQYEIGISEEKGKLTGFSHTWFILDDKQYYGVKKVKIKRKDGKIIVEDDGLIANNYPVAPAKGVRQLNMLVLDAKDSVMKLSGPFTTNRTKEYAPLTGTIELQRKNDYWQSALVPHLQELNLVGTLSFVKDDVLLAQNNVIIASAQPTVVSTKSTIVENKGKTVEIKNIPLPVIATETATIKNEIGKNDGGKNDDGKSDIVKNSMIKNEPLTADVVKNEDPKKSDPKSRTNDILKVTTNKSDTIYHIASANIPLVKRETIDAANAIERRVGDPVKINNSNTPETLRRVYQVPDTNDRNSLRDVITAKALPAADVKNRVTLLQQTVSFHSDSLQLSLYDNGEIDGDTVSVLMNGNIIMAKERLSTNAIRKTIYIPQETDSVQLVMYAENLGLIPPNTGLLVVKDGKDLYEIRFSGDLQKNAAILFQRKKAVQ